MTAAKVGRAYAAVAVGFLIGVTASGCGGETKQDSGQPSPKEKLEEVKQMLETVAADRQKPPSRMADLEAVEPMLPRTAIDIRKGDLVYLWGASLTQGGTAVVAYEKKAPTEGGWVLLQDGTVKQMSASEFQAAPKASKK